MAAKSLLAAIDLGSNSFRLLIGQAHGLEASPGFKTIDSVKRSVRLAAGLDRAGRLDADSQRRALEALALFAERLRSFAPDAVRAVATNTLRIASNARPFLANAEAVLGAPIEVISGHEEARLIYRGASSTLPGDGIVRLIVDIGGGSTECIVGRGSEALRLESIARGCVAATRDHFASQEVHASSFAAAREDARAAFQATAEACRGLRWRRAFGTSGTAKALCQIARDQFGTPSLDRLTLERMIAELVGAGGGLRLDWAGLKSERRAVLAGGLSVMAGVFDAFDIESMEYCSGALRQGILIEMHERRSGIDHRDLSVARLAARHHVDEMHAQALSNTALMMFDQSARANREALAATRQGLKWACQLAEVGMNIDLEDHAVHSAYIVEHAELAGFTRDEQQHLGLLALAQSGPLCRVAGRIDSDLDWLAVLSLRLAVLIVKAHAASAELPTPALFFRRKGIRLELPASWTRKHPRAAHAIRVEAAHWLESNIVDRFELVELTGPL